MQRFILFCMRIILLSNINIYLYIKKKKKCSDPYGNLEIRTMINNIRV